jgi:hypothetical protein
MDVKEWQDIEITIKNKNVVITINGKQVLSTQYGESSGMITGLGFISNGLPEVDFVNLNKLDGTLIYHNDFKK